jgi:hypothetical protein
MDATPIEILIEYATHSGDTGQADLLPMDYFDADALAGEIDIDSDPLHYDSAEYLDIPLAQLASVKLSLANNDTKRRLAFHTSYWNGGKNQITSRTEWNEGIITEEAITVSLATTPTVTHVVRALNVEGVLAPTYHRIFTQQSNGEETEESIV